MNRLWIILFILVCVLVVFGVLSRVESAKQDVYTFYNPDEVLVKGLWRDVAKVSLVSSTTTETVVLFSSSVWQDVMNYECRVRGNHTGVMGRSFVRQFGVGPVTDYVSFHVTPSMPGDSIIYVQCKANDYTPEVLFSNTRLTVQN